MELVSTVRTFPSGGKYEFKVIEPVEGSLILMTELVGKEVAN